MDKEDLGCNNVRKYTLITRFSGDFAGLRRHERSHFEVGHGNASVLGRIVAQTLGNAGARLILRNDSAFWYILNARMDRVHGNIQKLHQGFHRLLEEASRWNSYARYFVSAAILPSDVQDLESLDESMLTDCFCILFDQLGCHIQPQIGSVSDCQIYTTVGAMRQLLDIDETVAFVPMGMWKLPCKAGMWYELLRMVISWEELIQIGQSGCVRQSDVDDLYLELATLLNILGIRYNGSQDSNHAAMAYAFEHLVGTGRDGDPSFLIAENIGKYADSLSLSVKEREHIKQQAQILTHDMRQFPEMTLRGKSRNRFWPSWCRNLGKLTRHLVNLKEKPK